MSDKPKFSAQDLVQAAERYLDQTETYEAATQKGLAESLGITANVLYQRLPRPQWKQLQDAWMQNKIKQAIIFLCPENKGQEALTIEAVAQHTKIPLTIVRRFLPQNEQQTDQIVALTIQENDSALEQLSSTAQYVRQAKEYLTLTEQYKKTTIRHFAEFLGEAQWTIHRRLPVDEWEALRNSWIEHRLKQAMDATYAEARTRDKFNYENIAKHAKMPYSTVQRFLPLDEWETRRATLPTTEEVSSSYLLTQAEAYLTHTKDYESTSLECFTKFLDISYDSLHRKLPLQWSVLRNKWIKDRIEEAINTIRISSKSIYQFSIGSIARYTGIPAGTVRSHLSAEEWQASQDELFSEFSDRAHQAMYKVYAEAKSQEDFTIANIAKLSEISPKRIPDFIGNEWQELHATLPTIKGKVLAAIQKLVDADTPVNKFTKRYILEVADVNGRGQWSWFQQAHFKASHQLALHAHKQTTEPPPGINARLIPNGWVAIDDSTCDLRPDGHHLLLRKKLRADFAEIGWPILQEEFQSPDIALATIDQHYQGFVKAGIVLGTEVSDARQATRETMQRAWTNFNGSKGVSTLVRVSLVLIFEALIQLSDSDATINGREMLSILIWLRNDIVIGRAPLGEEFLSENEVNTVIQCCLADISAGITYTNTNPDLLMVSLNSWVRENTVVVMCWGTALMLLIMIFTGLRRQSVFRIKINDWAEVHTDLYLLAWRHNKKVEENVTVLPTILAQHLQLYVASTKQVRVALETDLVFLGKKHPGHWIVPPVRHFNIRLSEFVKRHRLEREGIPLKLGSTVMRRTYVTRALYEGRSLAALRSALGHAHFSTTARYAKSDQYEHPDEVGNALDEYGRKALTLWHFPIILDELSSDERVSLLETKAKREQDVGLCRHNRCVKAIQGSPPPCSLCEHLVTGPEFFHTWGREHQWRKQELAELANQPGSETMLAQMKFQFERFEANFIFIQERFQA